MGIAMASPLSLVLTLVLVLVLAAGSRWASSVSHHEPE
jgi:hypothetical protein